MSSYKRIEFTSPSLSSVKSTVVVDVHEKNPQLEPRILWNVNGRNFYGTDIAKCFDELSYRAQRTSIYTLHDDELKMNAECGGSCLNLASPEHLAPVFLMWPSRRFCVNVVGPCAEIPLMDGSALPFFHAIRREAGVPEELAFYDAPVNASFDICPKDGEKPYGSVRISPSETFEVEYVVDRKFDGINDGEENFFSSASTSIYSAEDLYNIFSARTFISRHEYNEARNQGLLSGVDESCGLILGEEKYRIAEEPAFHKILDLLGDLSFVRSALPRIRVEIVNGGHSSHRKILEAVLPYAVR